MSIDVIAKILHQCGYLVGPRRFVFAATYFNAGGAEIASVRTDSIERYSMKIQQLGRPEAKGALRVLIVLNHLEHRIKLLKPVERFTLREQIRI